MGMMIAPARFAASGPTGPYGAHTYWKLEIDTNNGDGTRTGFSEFKFYDQSSSQIATSGGTAFSGGSGADEGGAAVGNLFDGNNSTSWTRSSTTNVSCGYQFASAQAVASIDLISTTTLAAAPLTCRLRYSDDGSSYTTAFEIWEPSWDVAPCTRTWPQDFSGGKYKQIRFRVSAGNGNRFIAMNELEFRATVGGADQCTGGIASSDQAGTTPDRAFDNNASLISFIDTLASPFPAYIAYSFATPVVVAQYLVESNSDNTRIPNAWKLQGTIDGVTITDLNTQSGITGTIPFSQTYNV